MSEAPYRSQKIVSVLQCSVIEAINSNPFWQVGVVQKTPGEFCVLVALRHDDPKCIRIHGVLLRCDFHVNVIVKEWRYPHY